MAFQDTNVVLTTLSQTSYTLGARDFGVMKMGARDFGVMKMGARDFGVMAPGIGKAA